MKVWAVANQKGGVGKTTSAVTLGGLLAQRGERVLLVDLDPHGSLSTYFKLDPDDTENSVYSLFQQSSSGIDPRQVIQPTRYDQLHLMPASTALATLDRQLGTREGMGLVLARALVRLAGEYEHVFIDCPPILGVLMINAIAASQSLLMPVQTEFLALKGLERMMRTLQMVTQARKRPLRYWVIPTMFDRRTRASLETMQVLRQRYRDYLWRSVIPVDTLFREASRQGVPLSYLNPQARGVIAYTALLNALLAPPPSRGGSESRPATTVAP